MREMSPVLLCVLFSLAGCEARRVVGVLETPDATVRDAAGEREICFDGLDNNGDGLIDDGCECTLGARQSCWPGAAQRRGVGACRDGVQTCGGFGDTSAFGSCEGAVLPAAEVPNNGLDEDCDGRDEGGEFCEGSELDCADGRDDDCDGRPDCLDPECAGVGGCVAMCTAESSDALCADDVDNDCDGDVDCLDAECASAEPCRAIPPPPGCVPEFPFFVEFACGDGRDNDCDRDVDCADRDCRRPGICGCDSTETACGDRRDDDCDGHTDCEDIDCQECSDGALRWCNESTDDAWGIQACVGGRWGACAASALPPDGCDGLLYSASCCVERGQCCQNYPTDEASIGACGSMVRCLP